MKKPDYKWLPGTMVTESLIQECSELYSTHYGNWSIESPVSPGERVRLSSDRIRVWLTKNSHLSFARQNGVLVGYAISIQSKEYGYGIISWVTQLVVHEQYRQRNVAKILLFSIWRFSNHFAWGIISANPFAIRALEKATRRRCNPERIKKNKIKLINLGISNVSYLKESTEVEIDREYSRVNTEFFVDHTDLDEMTNSVCTEGKPWLLGKLDEGWEWFAFTFNDQEQIGLTRDEINTMMEVSDDVTKHAYSRMQLTSTQKWSQHQEKEASWIIEYCNLSSGQSVLDLGCGSGRHSIALAKRDLDITGIDYIKKLIDTAKIQTSKLEASLPQFIEADCRSIKLEKTFDAVVCLYDVIGSYVDNAENLKMLSNISIHLKPGGYALISVLNFELTEHNVKHIFSLEDQPDKLLQLPASSTMEKTGNIFNPDYYMIDSDTSVVYRKEQFTSGSSLPEELIVRDRRFRKEEIEGMCKIVGLDIVWTRYVSAGRWNIPLDKHDSSAKEILVLCRRRI